MAYREEMDGTWINNYSPFVSGFSTEVDATTLTSTEVMHTHSHLVVHLHYTHLGFLFKKRASGTSSMHARRPQRDSNHEGLSH